MCIRDRHLSLLTVYYKVSKKEMCQLAEAKLLKVNQDVETLEEYKTSFHTIYKGINKEHTSKRPRKKGNRRKSNERKKKPYENNVKRVYGLYVKNPQGQ